MGSPQVVTLRQQYNVREKTTVILYTYINRNASPPTNTKQKTMPYIRQPNPYREAKFSGANAYREIFVFPVQLTTSRIGNLTYPVDP